MNKNTKLIYDIRPPITKKHLTLIELYTLSDFYRKAQRLQKLNKIKFIGKHIIKICAQQ